jgi:hypothetical protein
MKYIVKTILYNDEKWSRFHWIQTIISNNNVDVSLRREDSVDISVYKFSNEEDALAFKLKFKVI